jgi:acetoacetate decarboxylase
MEQGFFDGVENAAAFYYDWTMIAADFCAPMAAVRGILPSDRLEPIRVGSGVAKVSLMAMEYRQTNSLAPYNEFGVLIPALYEGEDTDSALPGFYVYHLPVTSQQACDGGIKGYGFPKFVAQIDFDVAGHMQRCHVRAAGQDIITLEVAQLASAPQSWDFYCFTVKDNHLLRTLVKVQGQTGTSTVKGGARHTLGDHPIAEEVRALNIDTVSTGHQYAPQLQSILYLPCERLSL